MKLETKHLAIIVIGIYTALFILTGVVIGYSVGTHKFRGQLDTVTEQLSNATDTNTRLEQQLNRCRAITANLEETIGRDVDTIRGAVEVVEELRYEIACLENNLGCYDPDHLYEWYDDRIKDK